MKAPDTKKPQHGNVWIAALYVTYYGLLNKIANDHGYALSVHGSCSRDFDCVLIPWTEEAVDHKIVIREFAEAVGYDGVDWEALKPPTPKPHGRLAYIVNIGAGGYFDISVMPRIIPTPPTANPTAA